MSSKCSDLESYESKLRSAKEILALVIEQKEKQSKELGSYKRANKDLKAQLRDQGKNLKEVESQCRSKAERIKFLESLEYTSGVINVFRESEEFGDEVSKKSNGFFERGCAHVLRNFHHCITDRARMVQVYLGTPTDPRFKDGCDFVPFTKEEIQEIT